MNWFGDSSGKQKMVPRPHVTDEHLRSRHVAQLKCAQKDRWWNFFYIYVCIYIDF